MRAWGKQRRWWWGAIGCGLLLRLLFAWKHPTPSGDASMYADLAQNMLRHHGYALTDGAALRETLLRLPGYPVFMAACFAVFGVGKLMPVVGVQIVLALAGCWMLGVLAERRFGARVGLWVVWIACICPFTAEYDALPLTESLSLVCVIAAFFALEWWLETEQWRWAVGVGVACAWAVLVRPEQGLLAAAVVPVMLVCSSRRRWGGVGLAAVVVALPLLLWGVRNWRVFHVVQPLAPRYANDPGEFVSHGFDAWYRSWGVEYVSTVDTYWMWDDAEISMADLPSRAVDSAQERAETAQAYAAYNPGTTATPGIDAMFAKIARERARAHPLRTYVAMPVGRLADMWLRPRTEWFALPLDWWRFGAHPVESVVCLLWGALDWVLLGAAVWGLRRWRWDALGWSMIAFVGLRCVLLLTLDNAEPRYTLECFPVVFLLAALAVGKAKAES